MLTTDKITRTKLAMLVTAVLLTIFTTIGLLYMMTVSNITNIENGDTLALNMAMVVSIIIAFMWVNVLILFYEFKADTIMARNMYELAKIVEEQQTFINTIKPTNAINPDVFEEGGISGHISPK